MSQQHKIFFSTNPATGQKVWEGQAADKADADEAVLIAKDAFSTWSKLPLEERIRHLKSFAAALEKHQERLVFCICEETGKPLWDARDEVKAMRNKVAISIGAYQDRCKEMIQQTPVFSITRHKAHGVVAVLGPFNFPGHLPNGHIVPALLAGNTVIFKPSELTPLTGETTGLIWEEAGLPKGVVTILQGDKETGASLAAHPGIDGLFFTGSWKTGQKLLEQFALKPEKILALEMGGNNPLIVHEADPKTAAYLTVQSAYLTSGQRCTAARRLIVTKGQDAFILELKNLIEKIKVGPFTAIPEPFMGPVISEQAALDLLKVQEMLMGKGGKPILEMRQLKPKTGLLSPGLMDVTNVEKREDAEYFGPFLQLIEVENFDKALIEANQTAYGLSAGLLCPKKEYYDRFFYEVKAGIINWNAPITGASSMHPFGGVGRSGNHRPSAYYAADYCSYPVASMESDELKIQKLHPGLGETDDIIRI